MSVVDTTAELLGRAKPKKPRTRAATHALGRGQSRDGKSRGRDRTRREEGAPRRSRRPQHAARGRRRPPTLPGSSLPGAGRHYRLAPSIYAIHWRTSAACCPVRVLQIRIRIASRQRLVLGAGVRGRAEHPQVVQPLDAKHQRIAIVRMRVEVALEHAAPLHAPVRRWHRSEPAAWRSATSPGHFADRFLENRPRLCQVCAAQQRVAQPP